MHRKLHKDDIIVLTNVDLTDWAAPDFCKRLVREQIPLRVLDPDYDPVMEDRRAFQAVTLKTMKFGGYAKRWYLYEKVQFPPAKQSDRNVISATMTIT
jgi:hypothetical protein